MNEMKKIYLLLWGLCFLLFSGCKSINSKYIHEDEILYVKEPIFGRSGAYMYVDKFGTSKLPKEIPYKFYESAKPFSYRLALVKEQNGGWKYIDNNGDVVIDASEYDMCWGFEEYITPHTKGFKGLAYVCKGENPNWPSFKDSDDKDYKETGEKFGLINLKGQVVLPVEYDAILGRLGSPPYYDNIWWVRKDGLYGALNEKAKFIIPLQYTSVNFFERGSALVKLNGFWGLINKKGKTLFPFSITEVMQSGTAKYQPRILAKKDGYWGIINERGKTVIPFMYSRWEEFQGKNIVRMYKQDGSYITWNFRDDEYAE